MLGTFDEDWDEEGVLGALTQFSCIWSEGSLTGCDVCGVCVADAGILFGGTSWAFTSNCWEGDLKKQKKGEGSMIMFSLPGLHSDSSAFSVLGGILALQALYPCHVAGGG